MPEWLSIVIAVAVPLGAFAGVFFSRGRTEQRIVGRIDLLDAKVDGLEATIAARLDAIETEQNDSKASRTRLHEGAARHERKLDSLRTVCKLTHPERPMPDTVGGG
jgi:hypothetical protein